MISTVDTLLQRGRSRLSPHALLPSAAVLVFAVALRLWWLPASPWLQRFALAVAEVGLGLAAWREVSPATFARRATRVAPLLAVALHAAAFAAIALFVPVSWTSFMEHWYAAGKAMQAGQIPYRDFFFEYPPLAAVIYAIPAFFATGLTSYRINFAVLMLAFDFIGVGAALWMWRRHLVTGTSPWGVVLLQPLWLVWAGRNLVFEDVDLAPATLSLLAIGLLLARRHRAAWIVLALGVALKLYPAVLLPLLALASWQDGRRQELLGDVCWFLITLLISTAVVTQGSALAARAFLGYHLTRGLEIETTYASVLMLLHLAAGLSLSAFSGFGSQQVASPAAAVLANLALPVTGLGLAALYALAWSRRRLWLEPTIRGGDLIRLSMAAILIFILAGKVLSPQYVLWLYPFLPLLDRQRLTLWVLFSAVVLFTTWIYPAHWPQMVGLARETIAVLVARNACLLALLAIIVRPVWSRPARLPEPHTLC